MSQQPCQCVELGPEHCVQHGFETRAPRTIEQWIAKWQPELGNLRDEHVAQAIAELRRDGPPGEPPKVADARKAFWEAVERVKHGTDEPGLLEMCADNLIRALVGGTATP